MMTDLKVLKTVREEWTKDKYCAFTFVRDSDEISLGDGNVQSPDAAQWCVQGYIAKVMGLSCGVALWGTDLYKNVLDPITHAQEYPYGRNLASINNSYGHAAALGIIDEAIAQLEACEQEEYACDELVSV